jgi:ABC-type dipeptide/oligopeptide/nickel transport system ATPase component
VLAVVGESGCGKSVSMMSMYWASSRRPPGEVAGGQALFMGRDLLHAVGG